MGLDQSTISSMARLKPLKYRRDGFTPADTKSCQPITPTGFFQPVQQSGDQAAATCTDRVTDRDCTTVDIDLVALNFQPVDRHQRDCRKGGIDFEQVDLLKGQTGFGTDPFDGADRGDRELIRMQAVGRISDQFRLSLQAIFIHRHAAGQKSKGRAVIDG